MSRMRRLGVRARLALALAGVAVVAVGLATVLADRGLESRLNDFARDRLQASARHSAELAAERYALNRGWSPAGVADLAHLAQMNAYRLSLFDRNGRRLTATAVPITGDRARATVRVDGTVVGSLVVAPVNGRILTGEDQALHNRLNDLHLLAAVLAAALGLLAAAFLAPGLARPIRRLTATAQEMEQGNLGARTPAGGGPEIQQLAHALNRLSQTLQREDEIRRSAAADVAHELRTPLTGIVSRIEAAQDGVLADERGNLEAMHTEALRLTKLVEDLGSLADAQRPGLLIDKRTLDLAEVARRRARAHGEFFQAKGIAFEQELHPAPMRGDAGRLDQVLDNLLGNALRYTDRGGRVTLRVRSEGDEAVLEVEDTGIGIPPEDLPHIFERFWRGEKSRSRVTGGAGIGLAVVSALVTAHDGRIEVDSRPGRGSRFRVVLPASA